MDKQYAGLKELAEDRRKKLDHTYHHFLLSREVEDLEQWIAEKDVVASSQEMGQDLDQVTVLVHRQKHSEGLIYCTVVLLGLMSEAIDTCVSIEVLEFCGGVSVSDMSTTEVRNK